MSIDINENKKIFIEIINRDINRVGIEKLLDWLEKSDFFIAPASTIYHLCCEGGLAQHSLNVYNCLCKSEFLQDYNRESIAIVALFHDLCKVNFYKTEHRNTKNEQGQWVKTPYFKVEEKMPMPHGTKSYWIVSQFIKLDLAESMAIIHHMNEKEEKSTLNAFSQHTLAVELHIADLRATCILEGK